MRSMSRPCFLRAPACATQKNLGEEETTRSSRLKHAPRFPLSRGTQGGKDLCGRSVRVQPPQTNPLHSPLCNRRGNARWRCFLCPSCAQQGHPSNPVLAPHAPSRRFNKHASCQGWPKNLAPRMEERSSLFTVCCSSYPRLNREPDTPHLLTRLLRATGTTPCG